MFILFKLFKLFFLEVKSPNNSNDEFNSNTNKPETISNSAINPLLKKENFSTEKIKLHFGEEKKHNEKTQQNQGKIININKY
jgi:hypothetical protein